MALRVRDGRTGNYSISERWRALRTLRSAANKSVVDLVLHRSVVRDALAGGGGVMAEVT